MKKLLKWLAIALLIVVALLAIVPFLVPVTPLQGLKSARELALPEDQFITLPFEGLPLAV